jgi:signal transduction histidine kinase
VDILLAPDAETDRWQMIVRDTGIGIPPEYLPDVFLPFRRASDYTKRPQQGTGLGLSIAKRIAQLARGDIQVQSVVGHGSTFIVTLPINGGA